MNTMDQNSMESLNIILDDLQDMQLSIDLFEINSDANAPTFPLSHKINRLKDDEILNNDRGLTDINPDHAGEVIKHIIKGQYAEENRLLIKATVNKDRQNQIIGYGLNDVAIKRKETGRMIRIKVSIDQKYINTHEGDGFIVG